MAAPGGVLIRWVDQEVPFHASARAAPLYPAAVQALAEGHDTPESEMATLLCGAGTC